MLQRIAIKNYAIIDELEIDFSKKLNIITGETGAGKSILLGAIDLILGKRAGSNILNSNTKKCVIEATFDLGKYNLKRFFTENDLDYEKETLVRREIHTSGKSRAFINDTPVTLVLLRELSRHLVNLVAQHQTLYLNNPPYQMTIIDLLAQLEKDVYDFGNDFRGYSKMKAALAEKEAESQRLISEMDFIVFQLEELEKANFTDTDELEKLEKELKRLENADSIIQTLGGIDEQLHNDEMAVLTRVYAFKNMLARFGSVDPKIEGLQKRFESILLELEDVSVEMKMLADSIEASPQRLIEVQDRFDLINRLLKKHQIEDVAGLMQTREELQMTRNLTDSSEENLNLLKKELADLGEKLIKKAKFLRTKRTEAIPHFNELVQERLALLGLKNAKFDVNLEELKEYNATGKDQVHFAFSANPGSAPVALKQVASGGELSRLMLSVQSLLAGVLELPTIIFDEIDNGISGEVANKVGVLLEDLAESHQLIVITHLPQIASKGDAHFLVRKELNAGQTVSRINRLTEKERITEIAKMLSGDRPGENALANAQELLG